MLNRKTLLPLLCAVAALFTVARAVTYNPALWSA